MDQVTLRKPISSESKKVLLIFPSRLGDAVLSTPTLKNLESHAVTLVVDPLVQDLFDTSPMVVERISMPKSRYGMHWLKLRWLLRKRCFDHVIDLRGSWLAYSWPFAKKNVWDSKYKKSTQHKVEQVSACANMETQETYVWTAPPPRLEKRLDIILAPAANWVGKQWPVENFRTLSERILNTYKSAHIGYICAPHEASSVQHAWEGLPRTHPICDGTLTLGEIASLFRLARLFVGNDSGLMHLAVATQLPTIALFGPTNEHMYGPFEIATDHHTVIRGPQSYRDITSEKTFSSSAPVCYMNDLSIENVWEAFQKQAKKFELS